MSGSPFSPLSRLGLGCASIGNLYRFIPTSTAAAIVDRAWDSGIRYFDTAPFYGLGLSERRLGDALRRRPRNEYLLSTKVGRLLDPDCAPSLATERHGFVTDMPFKVRYDYSYDGVMRSFETSLQRLGLARIDILLVHDLGRMTHGDLSAHHFSELADGGYRALDELRSNGDVRAIGIGANEWEICAEAMEIGRWECFLLAGRYTLLEQGPLHSFMPKCEAHNAEIILGGPYNSGILATGTRRSGKVYYNYDAAPQDIIDRVGQIEAVCDLYGVNLAAAALQFPLAHPVVASVIPGIGDPARVDETLHFAQEDIPSAFWAELKQRALIDNAAPTPSSDV